MVLVEKPRTAGTVATVACRVKVREWIIGSGSAAHHIRIPVSHLWPHSHALLQFPLPHYSHLLKCGHVVRHGTQIARPSRPSRDVYAGLPRHGRLLNSLDSMSRSVLIMGRWLAIALMLWRQSVSAVAGDTYDLEYEMTLSMIERHKRLDIPVRPIMLVRASGRTTNQSLHTVAVQTRA